MATVRKSLNLTVLSSTTIRTASANYTGLAYSPDMDSGPSHTIYPGKSQWNTEIGDYRELQGFDFAEGLLQDRNPLRSNLTVSNNTTASSPLWLPSRGRILLRFAKTSENNTHLHYQVSETGSADIEIAEMRGIENTLLICPRDLGIGSNAPLTLRLWRTVNNASGKVQYTSEELVIYMHTYGEPEIHITNPKKVKGEGYDASENYVLLATEVINRREADDFDDCVYICPVLSLMVSQDALDDSGIESFTRVSVKEYLGYDVESAAWDDYTGYNGEGMNVLDNAGKLYNSHILSNSSKALMTAQWTGVFKDSDGSILPLSGIANMNGDSKDYRLIWNPRSGDPKSIVSDERLSDHTYGGAADLRLCFRSGYKYLITVRRFHGYAAGYDNLNSANLPQYAYRVINTDYPPHPDSVNDAWRIPVYTDKGVQTSDYCYPGPSLDNFNVAKNNAFARYTSTGEMQSEWEGWSTTLSRWVGPYAGDVHETDYEELYPGFSQTDYIVLDCVRNQTSTKNMITVRPASQEISADHWITFGYRHLARAQRGTDGVWTKPVDGIRESDGSVVYNTSGKVKYFNRNGIMKDESESDKCSESKTNESMLFDSVGNLQSSVKNWGRRNEFSNTWEGTDTTARRIGKMYTALVSRALREFVKCDKYKAYSEAIYQDASDKCSGCEKGSGENVEIIYHELHGVEMANIKPHIKIEVPLINYYATSESTALRWETLYEADGFSPYNADPDDSTNSGVFDAKNTAGFLGWYTYVTGVSGHKPAWPASGQSIDNYVRSANNMIVFNEDTGDASIPWAQYGNEYTWVPIINAQSKSTWLPTTKKKSGSNIYNPNKIVPDEDFSKDDTFTANYVEEGSNTWGGCSYEKFLKIDYNHTFNMTDASYYETSQAAAFDGSVSSPSAYGAIWEGNIPTADVSDTDPQYVKNKAINNRHFSITSGGDDSGYGGRQFFTENDKVSDQKSPGKLYLRVPTVQDCENGESSRYWTPREVANRFDYAVPTARTTHLGFYKTYVSAGLKITLTFNYNKAEFKYPEEGDGHSSGWVEDASGQKAVFTKTQVFEMKDIGTWGSSVGKEVGPFRIAIPSQQGYADNGAPINFYTAAEKLRVMTVFGEDNFGLGRCLTANDFSNIYHYADLNNNKRKFYFINELEPALTNNTGNGGGIEVPIRVRYTPIAQPELTDYLYRNRPTRTSKNSNVIKVCTHYKARCDKTLVYREWESHDIDEGMKYKTQFSIDIAYGLFNDKCRGIYKSKQNLEWYANQHRLLMGAPGEAVPSTDYYPAVGICNAFMVVLFPHDAVDSRNKHIDYFNQSNNFWSNRSNFETKYSYKGACPVIVADVATSDIYKSFNITSSANNHINNQLSTTFKCDFIYEDLLATDKVISNLSRLSKRDPRCKVEQNVWYDLVVVPIYTNDPSVDSVRVYKDGAGTINGKAFGGGTANAETVYYYGSNPLVIRNFLNISSVTRYNDIRDDNGKVTRYSCGGGGGGTSPTYSTVEPPFGTEGCILYPNVNHFKFNPENGSIKDCPGFWLNNTFRVVIRAPHYRTRAQIENDSRYGGKYNYEQPLETASNGQVENPEDFEFSDVMIHIGKYSEWVKIRDAETGEWVYDEDENFNRMRFNSSEFQDLIRRNALNKEWLNARNIYTIRTNPEAWSKRVPEVQDDKNNVRETIKAGSLTSSGSRYQDRMVVFNPNMVGAYTYEPEGYYMQVRFLNARYAGTTQQGTWEAWSGGILNDDSKYDLSQEADRAGSPSAGSWKKDESLEYYVPVRSYSDVYTTFRHYISGSTPGSYLTTPNNSNKFTANYTKVYQDGDDTVKGAGGHSPLHAENIASLNLRYHSDEASFITHGSVISDTHYTVPEINPIISKQYEGDTEEYQPWPADHDYTEYFAYLRDPDINSAKFAPSNEAIERYAAFHEMYYLDYIIRNMAKLYHSNWSEQCCTKEDMNAKDIGWTLAKEFITGYTKWSSEVSDGTSAYRKSKANKDRVVTDKFFKQSIKVEDFDNLLIVLKKLVDFTRNTKWSGIHTSKTDTTNSQGEHTGLTVLPVDSSRLSLNKCTDESVGGGRRMLIDADINKPDAAPDASINPAWKALEGNYIDKLWKILTELVIQDSDPDLAQ